MSWATKSAALLVVAAALAACGGNRAPSPSLEQARGDLLRVVGVLPLAGRDTPDLGSIKDKFDPVFLVATGRLLMPRERALVFISRTVVRAGFTVVEPKQPRQGAIAVVRKDIVTEIDVYDQLGVLRAAPGESFIQFQVGERDPRLGWTQVG